MSQEQEERQVRRLTSSQYKTAKVLFVLSWTFFIVSFIALIFAFFLMYLSTVGIFFSVLSFTLAYIATDKYGVVTKLIKVSDVICFILNIIMFLCFLILLVYGGKQ